jgi:hypothetical protein
MFFIGGLCAFWQFCLDMSFDKNILSLKIAEGTRRWRLPVGSPDPPENK